ncbi:MAG: crossover junction endodeoxyribonuclease RuvC [Bacteroidetes bacterium]|nr:crossover junction endodeoxyribonuclease RuvC [Bacteroidota bacterium]
MSAIATDKIVLGIDPGTNVMGYGIIHVKGTKMELVVMGVLRLEKVGDHALKLQKIFDCVVSLIEQYKPDEMSIEAPFFGKNVQSMLKLGRAQGVAIAGALSRNLPIQEYSPKKIKQSITGSGNASKEQVAAMLKSLLNFKETPEFLDATDGLAAAVCHHFQRKPAGGKKEYTGWKAFLADNPNKKA